MPYGRKASRGHKGAKQSYLSGRKSSAGKAKKVSKKKR